LPDIDKCLTWLAYGRVGVRNPRPSKRIYIKAPIHLEPLARLMEVKQFKLMAEFIKLSVFLAPDAVVPAETAATVARRLGYDLIVVHENG